MRLFPNTKISLARKCQILFGAAVLIIIGASLIIPAIRMNDLTREQYLRMAKESATVTLLETDLFGQDWSVAQDTIVRNWPRHRKRFGADELAALPPRLFTVVEAQAREAVGRGEGFLPQAISELQRDAKAIYRFKFGTLEDGRTEVRLAMGIREPGGDPGAGKLKGLIEVRIPIPPEHAILNIGVLAASLGLGSFLAVLVFYWVTQRVLLSPVRKLRRLAEKVTSGEISARWRIATGDEFEELGNAFNDMLGHLQDSQDKLGKTNKSLDTRLGELAETNVALFESNRIKSEFIANVSHELRTPLVSIIGFAELLTDAGDGKAIDPNRLKRYAGNILSSGRSLLDIINDLLDLAKIEAGKFNLHLSTFELEGLCTKLIDFMAPVADKADLELKLRIDKTMPKMCSDSGRLHQILYNLLSNAIKFTAPGGSVVLNVTKVEGDKAAFAVTDTGVGIPESQQATVFEKFRQMDSSVTREYSGTGLGLTITRELCGMLGGRIDLESTEGVGSTFKATLPLQAPASAPAPVVNLT
ncbi:MAG: HAMP domain-containing protein [Planctomycetes bacterium]|nr:HAMP domain-containing protein [Planctomycetota bacterium]